MMSQLAIAERDPALTFKVLGAIKATQEQDPYGYDHEDADRGAYNEAENSEVVEVE